ncbi:zinc finger protein 107-like [Eurosta solidaginis]|uniref:zinc finger protein 107-like n=1 Tax=Eurosta solidaginis TaxID=178769 RepID=UPI003530E219
MRRFCFILLYKKVQVFHELVKGQKKKMDSASEQFFDYLCRTCMHELVEATTFGDDAKPQQEWQSVFDTIEECGALRISDILSSTIPLIKEVQLSDELPKKICCECLQKLLCVYQFQQTCLQSDLHMRKLIAKRNDYFIKQTSVDDEIGVKEFSAPEHSDAKEFESIKSLAVEPEISVADPLESDEAEIDDCSQNDVDYVENGSCADVKPNIKEAGVAEPHNLQSNLKRHKRKGRKKTKPIKPKIILQYCAFKCDICNRYFHKAESLQNHRLLHDGTSEDKIQDDQPDKTPSSPRALAKIRNSTEKPQKPLKQHSCKLCEKSYKSSPALRKHVLAHHKGERFLCPECGKALTTAGNLKQHRLRHSDNKPFECPYCPMRFRCTTDVFNHKIMHIGIKSHICDVCGAAFPQAAILRKHKKIHSGVKPFKCEYCDMRFVRMTQQRCHMRTHTGEKPYKCKYCDRAYAQSGDHVKHLRTHLGDNVYRCEFCPLAFRLASELRLHFSSHKNEDPETRERNMLALKKAETQLQLKLATNNVALEIEFLEYFCIPTSNMKTAFNFRRCDFNRLNSALGGIDWDAMFGESAVGKSFNTLMPDVISHIPTLCTSAWSNIYSSIHLLFWKSFDFIRFSKNSCEVTANMDIKNEQSFDRLCRTCMHELLEISSVDSKSKQEEWKSIFDTIEEFGALRIVDILSKTIPQILEVQQSDELPKKICCKCLQELHSFYRFQQMCEQSDRQMREWIAERTITEPLVKYKIGTNKISLRKNNGQIMVFESIKTLVEAVQSISDDPLQNLDNHCKTSESDFKEIVIKSTYDCEEIIDKVETKEARVNSDSKPTCHICKKNFKQRRYLQNHLKLHDKLLEHRKISNNDVKRKRKRVNLALSNLTCRICNKTFKQRRYLQSHLKRHDRLLQQRDISENDVKGVAENVSFDWDENINKVETKEITKNLASSKPTCHLCNKTFSKPGYLRTHLKRHDFRASLQQQLQTKNKHQNYSFRCEICLRFFHKEESLNKHRLIHGGDADNLSCNVCNRCGKAYTTLAGLRRHEKKNHRADYQPKMQFDYFTFNCKICNRYFHKAESLYKHRLQDHGISDDELQQQLQQQQAIDKAENSHKCELCDKIYKAASGLRTHVLVHHKGQRFLCPECGKSLATASSLQQHRCIHRDDKLFECPYCPRRFRCSSGLSAHKTYHSNKKPHICDICGFAFRLRNCLIVHKRIHSGERPYKCDYCEKRFLRVDQQRRHMFTHTGEKPFKCKYCACAFAQGGDLLKHLRIHVGVNIFRCELCPSAFPSASERRLHFATHKHEDPKTREQNMKALKEQDATLVVNDCKNCKARC